MHYNGAVMNVPDPHTWLDSLTNGILVLNADWYLLYLNTTAQDLLGPAAKQAQIQPLPQCLSGASDLRQLLVAAEQQGAVSARELRLPISSDRSATVDATLSPLEDGCWLLELIPLDRRLQISHEANLATQQAVRRELTQGLAHEIRNPLGGIRGAAQLLAREIDDPELGEYTRVIVREADRLRDLLDRLLGPARGMQLELVNVHVLLEQTSRLVQAEAPDLQIVRDYDPSLPELHGDAAMLSQVLLNLLRNAAEATDGRGRLLLRSRPERQYTLAGTRHRLVLRLDIEDNGPGIPADMEARLFFPMVTGKTTGSGLGLSIAQDIVTRHGGLIEYRRRADQTVFSVYLPLQPPEEANP